MAPVKQAVAGVNAIALAAIVCAGCSFAFTQAPPDPVPRRGPIRCTESLAAPTADTFGAAGAALASVGALVANGPSFFLGPRVAAVDAALFVAYGVSAIVGYRRTYACSAARDGLHTGSDAADPPR
jgi:hypothetical protein